MAEHLNDVSRYLDAVSFARGRSAEEWAWGQAPFVTISREPGAGGHALAEATLRALARRKDADWARGWQTFDDALMKLVESQPRLKSSLNSLLREEYFTAGHDVLRQVFLRSVPQDVVLGRVFRSLRGLAGVGKVVILGRGGACLTRDLPGGVHVRLCASRASRLQRLQELWGLPRLKTERKMRELEESRAALIRDHFGRDVGDPLLYDACWNADRVSFAEIADWVVDRLAALVPKLERSREKAGAPVKSVKDVTEDGCR